MQRIYLDNAATSWPKPVAVYDAMDRYHRELGAPAGRSGYREAAEVDRMIVACRNRLAALIGADRSDRVVFTTSGTDSLNLALHGVLKPGDHVVTTAAEHNSILRPLRQLQDTCQVQVTRVRCDAFGQVDPDDIAEAVGPKTRLIAVTHASNVTGAVQPIRDISSIAGRRGALLLVDAAQTVGHLPIAVNDLGVDLLAAPGHKGLLGPLGTGVLYIRAGVERHLNSLRQGGTGTSSEDDRQPTGLPEKYESGNLNVPGLIGLSAGVDYLIQRGVGDVQDHCLELVHRLRAGLSEIPGLTMYGPPTGRDAASVVSIALQGYDPQEIAAALDSAYRVQARAGFHCAPLMHRTLGTIEKGGTVRFSVGPFNTSGDIDEALSAVREIAQAALS